MRERSITLIVNGTPCTLSVTPRTTLADALRDGLGVTSVHLGCEHGVCGACTVLVDGVPQRGCLVFAVTLEGRSIETAEGYATPLAEALRTAFNEKHALQCGYCTPGMLASAIDIIQRGKARDAQSVREELAGNLCRCTGYQPIVEAILLAAERIRS